MAFKGVIGIGAVEVLHATKNPLTQVDAESITWVWKVGKGTAINSLKVRRFFGGWANGDSDCSGF